MEPDQGKGYVPCGWRATPVVVVVAEVDGDVEHRIGDAAK
jgi:hypothetical protein